VSGTGRGDDERVGEGVCRWVGAAGIRAISGIPERSATRALKWALENGVLVNRDGTYALLAGGL